MPHKTKARARAHDREPSEAPEPCKIAVKPQRVVACPRCQMLEARLLRLEKSVATTKAAVDGLGQACDYVTKARVDALEQAFEGLKRAQSDMKREQSDMKAEFASMNITLALGRREAGLLAPLAQR